MMRFTMIAALLSASVALAQHPNPLVRTSWTSSTQATSSSVETASAECKYEAQPRIIAGQGWGQVRLGADLKTVDAVLGRGQARAGYEEVHFVDYAPKGIQISFENANNTVHAIFFYNRQRGMEEIGVFCGQTDRGINWQSSGEDVKKIYGQPAGEFSGTDSGGTWQRLAYTGIDFRFENGYLVRIGITGN
jgi:hypothetical protein